MIATPNVPASELGWMTEVTDGVAGGTIALILIVTLIFLELYRAYGETEIKIVKDLYYVVIPLLWVFSLGIIFAVVDAL